MKKIFTFSASILLAVIVLSSCVKDRPVANNESYWLNQEEGEVVYSDPYCDYYVIETFYGHTIVRSHAGYKPYEADLVYGNFSRPGTREMYNYTGRFVFTGTVTDYWLSYNEALDALDYYCPFYGKGTETRVFKTATKIKKK